MKKILMILTSHKNLDNTDRTTGVWLGEFTDPYYEFLEKGFDITLASPSGGKPPVDPMSKLTENITESNRKFDNDEDAQQAFGNTIPLSDVVAEQYDALFYPGGHGPMWDLSSSEENALIVLDFYRNHKPIGAVCHGPAALIRAAEKEPHLLRYKEITAYSNAEEKLVGLKDNIPFSLEDKLKDHGADYSSATVPLTPHVMVAGKLITGQNPASAGKAARKLAELLEE